MKGIIEIFNLEKAEYLMQFKGGNDFIQSMFTRGNVFAATDTKDGMLRVWSTHNFEKPFFEQSVGIIADLDCLTVSTDNHYISMAGCNSEENAVARIWKVV